MSITKTRKDFPFVLDFLKMKDLMGHDYIVLDKLTGIKLLQKGIVIEPKSGYNLLEQNLEIIL